MSGITVQTSVEHVPLRFGNVQHHIAQCAYCDQHLGPVAVTDLVYTFERCECDAAPYPHLVEVVWHRDCFVAASPTVEERDHAE